MTTDTLASPASPASPSISSPNNAVETQSGDDKPSPPRLERVLMIEQLLVKHGLQPSEACRLSIGCVDAGMLTEETKTVCGPALPEIEPLLSHFFLTNLQQKGE